METSLVSDHDVIVVGAGHNGLVTAAYLARAGLAPLVLEARSSVGGCASTVDAIGARVNICNCDHQVILTTHIVEELDLARHGLRYLDVDPIQVSVQWDGGPPWAVFRDPERTIDVLRASYPDEVDNYRRYLAAARPVAELVVELATVVPTASAVLRRLADRRAAGLATLLRWSRMTAHDVLCGFFRAEALRTPVVTTGPAVWGVSPCTPRTGLGALGYAMKHVVGCARPQGGSGQLPAALRSAVETAGGTVRVDARVSAITCERDRVRGVELSTGETITAPVVVSAADPRQTILEWLRAPPPPALDLVRRWRGRPARDGYESKVDAVATEAPRATALDEAWVARAGVDPLVATNVVSPAIEAIDAAHRGLDRGEVARDPMFLLNVPSVLDPAMQPEGGGHVVSVEVLYTPYALRGGWDGSAEPERWLGRLASLVQPGWLDTVRAWRAMTPPRYEAEFNLRRGYASSYGGAPLDALLGRRPELTRYRTPVRGLYLTGAGTYPGAGIWGASGRNTASVVLADRG
jgi:phytoene dehydrogenase-like protein